MLCLKTHAAERSIKTTLFWQNIKRHCCVKKIHAITKLLMCSGTRQPQLVSARTSRVAFVGYHTVLLEKVRVACLVLPSARSCPSSMCSSSIHRLAGMPSRLFFVIWSPSGDTRGPLVVFEVVDMRCPGSLHFFSHG